MTVTNSPLVYFNLPQFSTLQATGSSLKFAISLVFLPIMSDHHSSSHREMIRVTTFTSTSTPVQFSLHLNFYHFLFVTFCCLYSHNSLQTAKDHLFSRGWNWLLSSVSIKTAIRALALTAIRAASLAAIRAASLAASPSLVASVSAEHRHKSGLAATGLTAEGCRPKETWGHFWEHGIQTESPPPPVRTLGILIVSVFLWKRKYKAKYYN